MSEVAIAHCYNVERVKVLKEALTEKFGRLTYKAVVILDMHSLGFKHCSSDYYGAMRAMIDIDQYYYPEAVYRLYMINAPFIFKMAWKVIKRWLHPVTQEKVHILGEDYVSVLKELIDLNELPEFLGGTCKCDSEKCQAKFLEFILQEYLAKKKAGESFVEKIDQNLTASLAVVERIQAAIKQTY